MQSVAKSTNELSMPARPWWRDVLAGLLPLALLVCIGGITLIVVAIVRQLVAGAGFFVQQEVDVIILSVGLGLAYVVAAVLTLRRIAASRLSRAALWSLGVTAVVVVLPVVLAFVLPQHPAP